MTTSSNNDRTQNGMTTTTHQFLAMMGKKSMAGQRPPATVVDKNKKRKEQQNQKPKEEEAKPMALGRSIPSIGCNQVTMVERLQSVDMNQRAFYTYHRHNISMMGIPRPNLTESSHRARTIDEIFLYGHTTPVRAESMFHSEIHVSDKFDEDDGTPSGGVEVAEQSDRTQSTSFDDVSFKCDVDIECPTNDPDIENNCSRPPQSPPPTTKRSFKQRMVHKYKAFTKEALRFKGLKLLQCILAIIGGILTLYPPAGIRNPDTGLIVDPNSPERTEAGVVLVNGVERAVVADTHLQVILIGLTRMSAFFMYPCLVMVYVSKFRATISFLSKTPLAMYMYQDSHELHVYCGWVIVVMSAIHSIGHVLRWALQGNWYLLFEHFTGVSGLFIAGSCILITIPMTIFRTQIKYEIRKNLHFLFIIFAVALMFHTPAKGIPNGGFTGWVFGIILSWYAADATYCYCFMTEKIVTTKFSVLPCGVRMTMDVSERFQATGTQGGICYVNLPWIAKNQWHAFSLFENPSNPKERQIFIQKTGDWTQQVHRVLQRETVRPAWIHGPFPSPYDNAISYDNQVLVASGIGITPALSVIRAHKNTRRINLVWAVRDEALLDFFLKQLYLDNSGWNIIYYTGKKPLRDECVRLAGGNVVIISGRPNLNELIPNIIYGVESGIGLPEKYTPESQEEATNLLAERVLAVADDSGKTSSNRLVQNLADHASELGFTLPVDARQIVEDTKGMRTSARKIRASEMILENLDIRFRPWNYHAAAQQYVSDLDKSMVLSTWGILYCGGAKAVLDVLENVSDEYDIGLHVESFAW